MNPLIRKFWTDAGYTIYSGSNSGRTCYTTSFSFASVICIVDNAGLVPIQYFLNNGDKRAYSEEEMLKIIKMSAFI